MTAAPPPTPDLVARMAAAMVEIAPRKGMRCHFGDLIHAGFTVDEITRARHAARARAADLAQARVDREGAA